MPIEETYRNNMLGALPATGYLALFVGDPAGAGAECSGAGYARIPVTLGAAAAGVRSNTSGPHVFTVGAGGWQAGVNYSALFSASSGGSLISSDALDATRDMSIEGATMTFGVGDIDLSCN
jgi:hypothetical protein